jgi:hypothetical protein
MNLLGTAIDVTHVHIIILMAVHNTISILYKSGSHFLKRNTQWHVVGGGAEQFIGAAMMRKLRKKLWHADTTME